MGLWYPNDSPFHLEAFSQILSYSGNTHARRSTSRRNDQKLWKKDWNYNKLSTYIGLFKANNEHIPPTGLGLILLGDLTTIWETPETSDDDFWKNQEDWEIK
ncbi:hypothetical protein Tco_0819817 [Tanacetum coccineum]|uniref:Uncharacterized protein n=1 Tax=Tanacetum coccineum TaxID=301880 RepID=A0ABQ5ABN1_9ASTR